MSYHAFDTPSIITHPASDLLCAGYTAVGVYARTDRTTFPEVQELTKGGVKLWTIWEKGNPTDNSYFTIAQGGFDADQAAKWCQSMGQPGTAQNSLAPVFACVDFDAAPADVGGYLATFHEHIKAEGYLMGVYGSGVVCQWAKESGYAHFTWLAQSTGWQGYQMWAPHADIRQGPSGTALGYDVDFDAVVNPACTW